METKSDSYNINAKIQHALALQEEKHFPEAESVLKEVLERTPAQSLALAHLGLIYLQTGKIGEGIPFLEKSLEVNPKQPEVLSNLGFALSQLNRDQEGIEKLDKALELKPDYPEALNNRGIALQKLGRLDEALASLDRAIALRATFLEAHFNRGNVKLEIKRLDEALESYEQAIALKPDFADAFNNRGFVLQEMRRFQEALESYQRAFEVDPDGEFLFGNLLNAKMKICDWSRLEENLDNLKKRIESGKKTTTPFSALSLLDIPSVQLKASEIYVEAKYASVNPKKNTTRKNPGKARIGYYSADFHDHATSYLVAELFESHDRSKFEIFGFSFGPCKGIEMRERIISGFDDFFDVTKKTDRQVANFSRELGVDIAVDLKGYTLDSRPGIFAERCAPIQVNYLGYPGTMGAPFIDYIIADKVLIPEENRKHYSEKIIYMPNSYQVNDSRRRISEKPFNKGELGLPTEAFVFCCFNNNYKILPAAFDSWMRILDAVQGSVLWLLEDNSTAAVNLRKEAEKRGICSERLIFAKRMPLPEHLARHRLADLFLDTWPYNAHTTASDALWAGLPLITLIGQSFASRVAASLLHAIGLPDLITRSQQEYEAIAVELARNPERLSEIRSRLEKNRLTSSLFNGRLFARHLEAAYTTILDRYLRGLPPVHLSLQQVP